MTAAGKSSTTEERAIWLVSGLASLVINAAVGLALVSVTALERMGAKPDLGALTPPPDLLIEISPEMLKAAVEPATPLPAVPAADPSFARTSAAQRAARPDRARYFGERDTAATSDAVPLPGAPLEVPALAGAEPRDQIEATESSYQDGALRPEPALLTPQEAASALPPSGLETAATPAIRMPETPGNPAPPPAELLQGPIAVDTPERTESAPIEHPTTRETAGEPALVGEQLRETPPVSPAQQPGLAQQSLPKSPSDPAFQGNQEKTKMQGSISRKGKAALDVADTPLGRYQAQLSRAVELEWQRNCVRYRDLITPGFITVRFIINSKGKVTTLSFVEVVEVGEVQKGFTVNSIRNAGIPPMPAELARELKGEPLELTFNFYF
jgi:hypothetical protein